DNHRQRPESPTHCVTPRYSRFLDELVPAPNGTYTRGSPGGPLAVSLLTNRDSTGESRVGGAPLASASRKAMGHPWFPPGQYPPTLGGSFFQVRHHFRKRFPSASIRSRHSLRAAA